MEETKDCQARIKSLLGDRRWRLNNLYCIKNKSGQKVKMNFNWAQDKFYNDMWYFNVMLKARQLGFSTFIAIYMLDAALFNSDHKCGIIDYGIDAAKQKLEKAKYAYDNLPDWLKELKPMTVRAAEQIGFANGSGLTVGTSHRGDTLQKLHISEYGKISAASPQKALEIKTGALNAVDYGQQVFVESTAEGKSGEFYELVQLARQLQSEGRALTPMDPKFHFFAWFDNPDYALDDDSAAGVVIPDDLEKYLAPLNLSLGQRSWYAVKERTQGDEMRREYPSSPDEAFEGSAQGAYYTDEMLHIRKNGQICNVPYDARHPVFTFWDLGGGADQFSIWFYQFIGGKRMFIDYHESSGNGWSFYSKLLRDKGYNYGRHYFPHDGNTTVITKDVTTRKQLAEQVGITPVKVVKRTKSVSDDIRNFCKPILPMCYFDEKKCALGISRLDGYRRKWDKINGQWLDEHQHDEASHGADAYRTYAVIADQVGIVDREPPKSMKLPKQSGWMGL